MSRALLLQLLHLPPAVDAGPSTCRCPSATPGPSAATGRRQSTSRRASRIPGPVPHPDPQAPLDPARAPPEKRSAPASITPSTAISRAQASRRQARRRRCIASSPVLVCASARSARWRPTVHQAIASSIRTSTPPKNRLNNRHNAPTSSCAARPTAPSPPAPGCRRSNFRERRSIDASGDN